jgi:hypothetical protein
MATNPDDIRLGAEERRLLADLADQHGKAWGDVFRDALLAYARLAPPSDRAEPSAPRRRVIGLHQGAIHTRALAT